MQNSAACIYDVDADVDSTSDCQSKCDRHIIRPIYLILISGFGGGSYKILATNEYK